MQKQIQIVKLDENGNGDRVLVSGFKSTKEAERWIELYEPEIGGRMSEVVLTIRTVYIV